MNVSGNQCLYLFYFGKLKCNQITLTKESLNFSFLAPTGALGDRILDVCLSVCLIQRAFIWSWRRHALFFSCKAQLNTCTCAWVCQSVGFKTEFLTVFPSLWHLMTAYDSFWQLMTAFGSLWQLTTSFDSFDSFFPLHIGIKHRHCTQELHTGIAHMHCT